MRLSNFLKFVLPLVALSNVAFAANWIPIKGSNLQGLVIDSQSISAYPGMVVFTSRHGASDTNSLFFFNKAAYLCGSREVWGIATKIESSKNIDDSVFIPEVSDAGIREYLSIPSITNHLKQFCGSRLSKKSVEIPIGISNTEVRFFLAKETSFSGKNIQAWTKNFNYITTPYIVNGEPLVIKGETIMNRVIQRDGSYEVVSFEYDCLEKTSRINDIVKYSGGNVQSSSGDLSKTAKFERVVPGSVGQQKLEFVCSLK